MALEGHRSTSFPYIDYSEVDGKTIVQLKFQKIQTNLFSLGIRLIFVGRSNQRLSSEIEFVTNENNVTSDQQVLEDATIENIDKKLNQLLERSQSRRNLDLDPKMPIEED